MTPEQLKASILQYAMEGKLVSQNPDDEPASVLLEKIKAKKEELVKEGKIKRNKKLPPINDEEKPFEIPESWKWVRLGSIAEVLNGDRGKNYPGKAFWIESGVPFVNAGALGERQINSEKLNYISEKRYKLLRSGFIQKNDILYCLRGSLGKVSISETNKGAIASSLCIIRLFNDHLLDYIWFLLNSNFAKLLVKKFENGTAQPNLSANSIEKFYLPIPPLKEQKRIVEKIEKLMPLVDKYAKAYNTLQKIDHDFDAKLKQSILQYAMEGKLVSQDPNDEPASVLLEKIKVEKAELVKEKKIKKSKPLPPITDDEKPFDIPDSWEWVRLGDYSEKVTDYVASGSFAALRDNVKKYKSKNYALMVKTADFSNNFSKNLTYTDKVGYKFLENSNLFGGELILSNIGSIGKCFIVPHLKMPMTLASNSIMIKLLDDKLQDFLYYFIKSPVGFNELIEITSGTTMKKFNKTNLKKIIIPVPPIEEQQRIVNKLKNLINFLL